MFRIACLISLLALASGGIVPHSPIVAALPAVGTPIVAARSSQFIARNYNRLTAPLVYAPAAPVPISYAPSASLTYPSPAFPAPIAYGAHAYSIAPAYSPAASIVLKK